MFMVNDNTAFFHFYMFHPSRVTIFVYGAWFRFNIWNSFSFLTSSIQPSVHHMVGRIGVHPVGVQAAGDVALHESAQEWGVLAGALVEVVGDFVVGQALEADGGQGVGLEDA